MREAIGLKTMREAIGLKTMREAIGLKTTMREAIGLKTMMREPEMNVWQAPAKLDAEFWRGEPAGMIRGGAF
jgi:hypothetical protein